MKVLLDLPIATGGVGRYGRDLVAGLRGTDAENDVHLLERPRLGVLDRAFTPWGRITVALTAAMKGVDLVHGLHFEVPRTTTPSVVTVPDLIPLQFPPSMPSRTRRRVFDRLVRMSTERARAVIVPSPATSQALIARGVPARKVSIIEHGVGAIFHPLDDTERSSARRRYADGSPYVACVGSDKPHKNLSVVPAVAKLLAPHAHVVIVGIFPAESSTFDGVNMRRAGYLDDGDLRTFYGGAEVLVVPSLIEGFGLPALEALGCGTPVICGSGLGALPYINDGVILVDVSDPVAIADAARQLVVTPLREELSGVGRRIAQQMTLDEMGRRTLEVYRRVLG